MESLSLLTIELMTVSLGLEFNLAAGQLLALGIGEIAENLIVVAFPLQFSKEPVWRSRCIYMAMPMLHLEMLM